MKQAINRAVGLSLLAMAGLLASCQNNNQTGGGSTPLATSVQENPVLIPARKETCFQQVSGNGNTDTIQVQLTIAGDRVTGTMDEMHHEKDARHGRLSGMLLENVVKATWRFMQEGVQDSLELEFKLGNDTLLQRPLITDATTGHQVTDLNSGYSIAIPAVDCH